MAEGISLTDWLSSTQEKRAELLAYAKSPISMEPGQRQIDVSTALEKGQDSGDLLADSEVYLAQKFAAAVLAARDTNDAQTARIVAKGEIAGIQRLRDGLAVIYQTIKDRRFSLMNLNRSA